MSVLGNNLLAQYYAQNQGLPFGYEEVEYLESNPAESPYIDTGVYLGNTTGYEIELSISDEGLGSTIVPFGSRNDDGNTRNWINFTWNTKAMTFGWNNYVIPSGFNRIDTDFHTYTVNLNNNRKAYIDNVERATLNAVAVKQKYTAYVFGANNYGTLAFKNSYIKVKILRITSYTDNIRNYVTCVRKSDGKPGMYDLCRSICPLTGTPFYINAGTGEFVTP